MDELQSKMLQDKIYEHMMSVDLSKLSMVELISYIDAYRILGSSFSFPGFGMGPGYPISNIHAV